MYIRKIHFENIFYKKKAKILINFALEILSFFNFAAKNLIFGRGENFENFMSKWHWKMLIFWRCNLLCFNLQMIENFSSSSQFLWSVPVPVLSSNFFKKSVPVPVPVPRKLSVLRQFQFLGTDATLFSYTIKSLGYLRWWWFNMLRFPINSMTAYFVIN